MFIQLDACMYILLDLHHVDLIVDRPTCLSSFHYIQLSQYFMTTSASSVRLRKELSFKGSAGLKCKCNLETKMKISRSAKHLGRGYYNYPKYPDSDRC